MQSGAPKGKKGHNHDRECQRRVTRMVPSLKDLTYPERLKCLKLPTLAHHHLRGDMIKRFKIIRYDSAASPVMSMARPNPWPTWVHPYKAYSRRTKTCCRQLFFTERVTNVWNSLPSYIVEPPSIEAFERRIGRYWRDHDIVYIYEAALSLCH